MIIKKLVPIFLFIYLAIFISGCAPKKNSENDLAVALPKYNLADHEKKQEEPKAVENITDPLEIEEPNIRDQAFEENLDLKTIYFDFDSYEIKQNFRDMLFENVKWLKSNPDYNILIEGHTDSRGSEKYNLGLGQKRASVVREYIAYLGVDAKRIGTISYGEEKPIDPAETDDAWSKNRRAEFLVYKRQ